MTRRMAREWFKEIQAFAEGKDIQVYNDGEWCGVFEPLFDEDREYRIKPESKLIPFDFSDAEKLIGKAVKYKNSNLVSLITDINENYVFFANVTYSFITFLNSYTFLDGSPCGKVVDSE